MNFCLTIGSAKKEIFFQSIYYQVIRQAQLQAFFSISCCKCLACEKNYPLLSEISDDLNGKSFGKGKNPFR